MPLVLSRIALLKTSTSLPGGGGGGPPPSTRVKWENGYPGSANCTLSLDEYEFFSDSTNGNYYVLGDKILDGTGSVGYFSTVYYYWEIEFKGAATGNHNSYHGVQRESNWGTVGFPHDGVAWRGNGDMWKNDNSRSGYATYDNDDRIMFCFSPQSREFWIGKNGVWEDDPDTDPATETADAGQKWRVTGQSRFGGSNGGVLHSTTDTFAYTVPSKAIPLGQTFVPGEGLALTGKSVYALMGRPATGLLVSELHKYSVVGRPKSGILQNEKRVYSVLSLNPVEDEHVVMEMDAFAASSLSGHSVFEMDAFAAAVTEGHGAFVADAWLELDIT